jgi:hypothetical protein
VLFGGRIEKLMGENDPASPMFACLQTVTEARVALWSVGHQTHFGYRSLCLGRNVHRSRDRVSRELFSFGVYLARP